MYKIRTNLVNIAEMRIYPAQIFVEKGIISQIEPLSPTATDLQGFALCGFIDAHVHIESSMLVPQAFADLAVRQGTVATVSDPHEIANVLGLEGVLFMIRNGKSSPLKFYFGAPSCVPATGFETAGAILGEAEIEQLLQMDEVHYLAEMMNYPGVIHRDPSVMAKIAIAKKYGKPIDGHAPALRGSDLERYIDAGISTDHECFTAEEAQEKLQKGMKILIREGSAAKNFEALIDLLPQNYRQMMFCSDDKHPDDLLLGHINQLVARAVKRGCDLFDVLQVACLNPIDFYKLDVGKLQVGDSADFIIVEDLQDFKVVKTFIDGQLVFDSPHSQVEFSPPPLLNQFHAQHRSAADFRLSPPQGATHIQVIEALDGELITRKITVPIFTNGESNIEANIEANLAEDILKIAVVNRYEAQAAVSVAFIKNFGLKRGAIASTVAHDSHNIIAVGTSDAELAAAVNALIDCKGGVVAVENGQTWLLSLPIAGLMSDKKGEEVAAAYTQIDAQVKKMGTRLKAPFMTLSFMALLVIPNLKISDKGLFEGDTFAFTELFVSL
jgi:adenine deaminase